MELCVGGWTRSGFSGRARARMGEIRIVRGYTFGHGGGIEVGALLLLA